MPCTIIDALPHRANSSRAAVVHARTLEVLHPLNIADPLISEGLRATRFTIRDRDRALMTIGFADLPTSYPYTLMMSQATTRGCAAAQAHRPRRARPPANPSHRSDPDGRPGHRHLRRRRHHHRQLGRRCRRHACTVREHTGIASGGAAYPESFLLADVTPQSGAPGTR